MPTSASSPNFTGTFFASITWMPTPNLATGVGIQVIDEKSVPVKFGEETLVGTSRNGDYVLNYTARYFQTGNQVTPGRADGTATFSIEYK